MNTPFIWIVFPGLVAGVLYFLRHRERAVIIAGVITAVLLAWLAWRFPIGDLITVGPWTFRISDTLWILGRRLILTNAERPILVLVYLAAAFWLGGAGVSRAQTLFVPTGLAVVALLVASLAVDPFLYAALFIEMAALLCIPLLVLPRAPAGRGVLRFLSFQTLGVPFILFSGWLTAEIENNPNSPFQALQIVLLAAIGFAFLLAIFPFHTWMPMLAQESHPYPTAFVFYMLPGVVSLFGIKFIASHSWLANTPELVVIIRWAGALMIAIGGFWAAFQRHTGRILAYAVMVETGYSILVTAIYVGVPPSSSGIVYPIELLFPLFLSRALALGAWALALSVFYTHTPGLSYLELGGAGRRFPIAAGALVLAHFALAGLPLLAGFPVRLSIIGGLGQAEPVAVVWILLGIGGLAVGGLRTLAVLVMGPYAQPWVVSENRPQRLFLVAVMAALLLAGIFPMV